MQYKKQQLARVRAFGGTYFIEPGHEKKTKQYHIYFKQWIPAEHRYSKKMVTKRIDYASAVKIVAELVQTREENRKAIEKIFKE